MQAKFSRDTQAAAEGQDQGPVAMETDEPSSQHLGDGAAAQDGLPAAMQSRSPVHGQPGALTPPPVDGMDSAPQNGWSNERIDAKQAFDYLGISTSSTPEQILKKYRKLGLSLIAA